MTKILSTQELIKLVYSPDVSFEDMLEAAIGIQRTALLTELREWVEENIEYINSDLEYINSDQEKIKDHLDELINSTK